MKIIIEQTHAYSQSYKKKLRRNRLIKDGVDSAIKLMKTDQIIADKIERPLWPEGYKRFRITNLWRYEIRDFRLIYTIRIESGIKKYGVFDILTHKEYDKLFGFHTS
ncbi:MAG: hypothetical protein ACRD8W_01965 [Nitrososphaeraceae archaeon]